LTDRLVIEAPMMEQHDVLTIDVTEAGDVFLVRCAGRLISSASARFQGEVKRLIPRTSRITIDLTDVSFMDSMGLGTIAALYVSAKTAGCQLQLVNLTPRVRELFSITHLLSLFEACGESNIPIA
jgi:anti-sigma B factor antagonist